MDIYITLIRIADNYVTITAFAGTTGWKAKLCTSQLSAINLINKLLEPDADVLEVFSQHTDPAPK